MSLARRPMIVVLAVAVIAATVTLALVVSGVLPFSSDTEAGGSGTPTADADSPEIVEAPGAAQTTPPTEGTNPDRFVITYDENSPVGQILANVETYGENVLQDLPPEQQAALLAVAEQFSVAIESITAHSGSVAAIDLSGSLTPEQIEQFTALLEQLGYITSVEPELTFTPLDGSSTTASTPDDAYFSYQWNLTSQKYGISATDAWSTSTGEGVTVAVVDSGILPDHPDLQGQVLAGYDFISDASAGGDGDGRDADPTDAGDGTAPDECGTGDEGSPSSWHGSHVAGIIAANANDGIGIAGVAPGAKILPVRVLGRCGGYATDAIDALTWASGGHVNGIPDNPNPAQVVNMSLGGPGTCPAYYQEAIDAAVARGTIIVVAAGNEDQDAAKVSPASCNNVITVGASGPDGARTYYSNYGSTVEVSAPGGDIDAEAGILSLFNKGETTATENSYAFMEGTSQASPHVAATVAMLKAMTPELTHEEALTILQQTSTPLSSCDRDACGSGIINAAAAVAQLSGSEPAEPRPSETPRNPWRKNPTASPTPSPTNRWHKD